MTSPRLKLGRKADGDCPGIGRDPMLVQQTRRQKIHQLGTNMSRSRNRGHCRIKMGMLNNVNEYSNSLLDSSFPGNCVATFAKACSSSSMALLSSTNSIEECEADQGRLA